MSLTGYTNTLTRINNLLKNLPYNRAEILTWSETQRINAADVLFDHYLLGATDKNSTLVVRAYTEKLTPEELTEVSNYLATLDNSDEGRYKRIKELNNSTVERNLFDSYLYFLSSVAGEI